MPWWAQLYLAVLVLMAVATVALEAHRGDSLAFLLGELLSMIGLVIPYMAYWVGEAWHLPAWLLWGLVGFSFAWETFTLDTNLARHGMGGLPRSDPALFLMVLVLGYALLAPGWAMGVLAGMR